MANPTLLKTGSGTIPTPLKIQPSKDGTLSDRVINAINSFQQAVTNKINGRITFGDGSQSSLAGNLYGQYREFTTPGTPDTTFQVDHALGKNVVGRIVVRQDAAAHLYDANLGGWGDDAVYFRCDTASVLFKVLLFADIES